MLWCFADVLLFGHVLAFRETANYEFPQSSLIADEIFHRRLPLWNPYLNTGVPLLATGNTGMFSLPLWLALIRPGELALVWSLYVVADVAPAAWAAYRMGGDRAARRGVGRAGVAYALAAPLVQNADVVYLVGAPGCRWRPGRSSVFAVDRCGAMSRDSASRWR